MTQAPAETPAGGATDAVGPGAPSTPAPPTATAPLARLRPIAARVAKYIADHVRQWGRRAGYAWRHSLQLRVGATTVVITGIVVLIVGILLVDQVAGGILRAKKDAAITQAKLGLASAQPVLAGVDAGVRSDVDAAQQQIRATLTASGGTGGLFTIVIESTFAPDDTDPTAQIPPGLRDLVQRHELALQYAPVPTSLGSKQLVRGLIVGEPVPARTGLFELYYLFPLTAEENTIALVQRTVLLSGLGLMLLVLGIALLVTRQVVRPVRVAAETAGRLAAGDLAQRIKVSGTDDIARLGQSFNDMAGSLQRQIRRLEDLSRLQRRFTSDVSHELRTPLTTIRMASELLHANRAEFPPELGRSAELLHAQLDRFEELLADLLEISRYDAGVARLDSETTDLRGVVTRTVDANRMLADRHGSELVLTMPEGPVTADVDVRRVERILRNLVANALDHGEGKRVEVTLAGDDDSVAVTVRDHGIGLRPGEAALVFNRFWRGDPSRSRLTGGTGLGLAISLEDARLHDGWLQAWGERGKGAQFRLTLPRKAGHTVMSSPLPLTPHDDDEADA